MARVEDLCGYGRAPVTEKGGSDALSAERWMFEERRRADFLKDRFASLTILGSSFIAVIYLVTLWFNVLLTPSVFLLLVVVSVGSVWAFIRHREMKQYLEGLDAFYMSTRFQYEKAKGRKRG